MEERSEVDWWQGTSDLLYLPAWFVERGDETSR